MAGGEGVGRDAARLGIGGEGMGRTSPEVARKLVEQEEQGERPLGFGGPGVVLAPGGGVVKGFEIARNGTVESRILLEPERWAGLAPEGHNLSAAADLRWKQIV